MKGKLYMYKVNGAIDEIVLDKVPDLEMMQKLVDGPIEHVPRWNDYFGVPCAAFCDEEGKNKGKPVNPRATLDWYSAVPSINGVDTLNGDVIVITGDEELMEAL